MVLNSVFFAGEGADSVSKSNILRGGDSCTANRDRDLALAGVAAVIEALLSEGDGYSWASNSGDSCTANRDRGLVLAGVAAVIEKLLSDGDGYFFDPGLYFFAGEGVDSESNISSLGNRGLSGVRGVI